MHRLADAVDLAIDFATLGEYGLEEPVGSTPRDCELDRARRPKNMQRTPAVRAGMRRGREAFEMQA
jgi:hypothetical protein